MSNERNKVSDKAGEIARNIWLAGVGAYGRAVEDAQERLEKAMEPPKLFRDLVKAGAALEEEARGALQSTAAARQSVEERISRVRENFHMQRPARIEDLAALQARVEALAQQVEGLRKALKAQGVAVPEKRRRPAVRKPARAATAGGAASRKKTAGGAASRKKKTARGAAAPGKAAPRKKAGGRNTGRTSASAPAGSARGKRAAKKSAR